jgi:hypothetical protein
MPAPGKSAVPGQQNFGKALQMKAKYAYIE